jgi:hypothetical protein
MREAGGRGLTPRREGIAAIRGLAPLPLELSAPTNLLLIGILMSKKMKSFRRELRIGCLPTRIVSVPLGPGGVWSRWMRCRIWVAWLAP